MAILAQDPAGKPFGLPKRAFLGQGADPKLKADVQGCGEFNPLIMFSAEEVKAFKAADQKERRDEEGAPNRRVTVFLFPGNTKISLKDWPCPRATEGTASCRKRFWSDQLKRRTFGETRRRQPEADDTFACRFYDRIALDGARGRKGLPLGRLVIRAESVGPSPRKRELVVLDPAGKELARAVLNPDAPPNQAPPPPEPGEIRLKSPPPSGHHAVEKQTAGEAEPSASRVDLLALLGAVLRERDRMKPDQVVTEDRKKTGGGAKDG
jgi:hypothetical protein